MTPFLRIRLLGAATIAVSMLAVTAAASGKDMSLQSPAFDAHQPIPQQFSCFGAGKSPPIQWSGVPARAESLAITIVDPDAPNGHYVHWVVYDLSPSRDHLPINVSPSGLGNDAQFGQNSRGQSGYTGLCPPRGTHHYHLTLYALDTVIRRSGLDDAQLRHAIRGHVLAKAHLIATLSHP